MDVITLDTQGRMRGLLPDKAVPKEVAFELDIRKSQFCAKDKLQELQKIKGFN
jgi:hypothetical protein